MKDNKLGRNEVCHCGSSKKYKRCCLSSDATSGQPSNTGQSKAIQLQNTERFRNRVQQRMGDKCSIVQGELRGIKMSAVILELADFLLEVAHTKERQQAAITITCIAWNIAVAGIEKTQKLFDAYFETIDDPIHQQDTLDIINEIIERKRLLYPEINRLILDYEVSGTKNNLHLNVVSTVPDEEVAKLKQEQATALLSQRSSELLENMQA
jgi:hypothetical protein